MKMQTNVREIEISGIDAPVKAFTIKNSAMAFKILSDKLYSDKPLAVIRELSCNAYDAHVAAGKEKTPFTVHLPNNFEPYFSIRDYGTGLSDKQMQTLYTTYFGSDKQDSNDFIGGLGLGSKSPFAYVDQFTVISYFKGTKTTYNAFIDASGTPSIVKTSEEPTDEFNGLEIYMPVEAGDFTSFCERAQKVYYRFPVQPIITGNTRYELPVVEYVLDGPNYKLRNEVSYNSNGYGYNRRNDTAIPYAVQGVVAYPIDFSQIQIPMTDIQKTVVQNIPVDIFFNVGDLEVAPSREALSYDKRTQKAILDAVDKIIEHVPLVTKDIIADAKTEWEARKLWSKWMGEKTTQSYFFRTVLGNELTWNNKKIKGGDIRVYTFDFEAAKKEDPKNFQDNQSYVDASDLKTLTLAGKVVQYGECKFYGQHSLNINNSKPPKGSISLNPEIDVDDNTVIVLMDPIKKSNSIGKYLQHNYGGEGKNVWLFDVDPVYHQKIIDQLGGCPETVLASTLELPPDDPKTVVPKNIKKCYRVSGISDYSWGTPFEIVETTHDLSKGGYYAILYNKALVQPGDEFVDTPRTATKDMVTMVRKAYALGLLRDKQGQAIEIHAFNNTFKTVVKKNPLWVNIFDVIRDRVNDLNKDPAIKAKYSLLEEHFSLLKNHGELYSRLIEQRETLAKIGEKLVKGQKSKFCEHIESVNKLVNAVENHIKEITGGRYEKLYDGGPTRNGYNVQLDVFFNACTLFLQTAKPDFSKAEKRAALFGEKIKQNYPLLEVLLQTVHVSGDDAGNDVVCRKNKKLLAHYLNLCDASPTLVSTYLN